MSRSETDDGSTFDSFLRKVAQVSGPTGEVDALVEGPRDFGERFDVVRILGRGGMGVVYEVVDRERDRHVALKTLARMDPNGIHRFKNEFRSLAGLSHPHLVQLHELFCEGGWWFFTMELVRGRGLLSALQRAPRHTWQVFGRLAGAIAHLHDQGLVHRDLKPSNVLVTDAGDVRLLDYGLVAPIAARPAGDTLSTHIAGTPAYMAPEQRDGRATRGSDWFAFGRMLGEALEEVEGLLGEHPLVPRTRELAAGLVAEVEADRPSVAEVLDLFEMAPVPTAPVQPSVRLVGRDAELEQLLRTWAVVERGGRSQVWVDGSSGIGKSALLAALVQRVGPHAVVLSGRCYQRESVPFNAFDEVVDAAVRELRVLPETEAAALLPRGIHHAARIFPALRRVKAVASVPEPAPLTDPVALRRTAIGALVGLLATVSDQRPILVCIDDLQWGDADSALLWMALSRGVPRLLLVGATRSEERAESAFFRALGHSDAKTLSLGPLSADDAAALAVELHPELSDDAVDRLVRDCHGQPFLLSRVDGGDAVLADRIEALEPAHRTLLDAVAVSDGPVPLRVLERVVGRGGLDRDLAALTGARLLRSAGVRTGVVECYHDRVRETVAAAVQAPRALHEALAEALQLEPEPDAELVAHHLVAAEHPDAWSWAERAGDGAAEALAPDSAVRWYRIALERTPVEAERRVRRKLADSLADAGLGSEGAEHLLALAVDADAVEAMRTRSLAALWLLSFGRRARALALYDELFAEAGLWFPRSLVGQGVQFVLEGARMLWRGLAVRPHAPDPIEEARVEMLCGRVSGFAYESPLDRPGLFLLALRRALDLGEPVLVARTLCYTSHFLAFYPAKFFRSLSRRTLHALERHAAAHPEPAVRAMLLHGRTLTKMFDGYYGSAAVDADQASAVIDLLPLHGVLIDRETMRLFRGNARWYGGDAIAMYEELRGWEADAEARGNRHLASWYRMTGWHALTMLGQGRMDELVEEEARNRAAYDRAMGWEGAPQEKLFNTVFGGRLTELYICLFRDDPDVALPEAEAVLAKQWADPLSWSVVWRNHLYYLDHIVQLRLAGLDPSSASRRVARVRRLARRSAGEGRAHCDAHAALIKASLGLFEDDRVEALAWLRSAEELYGRCGMQVLVTVVRRVRGLVLGGERGDGLVAEADADLARQGVTELDAFTRFWVYLPERVGRT